MRYAVFEILNEYRRTASMIADKENKAI